MSTPQLSAVVDDRISSQRHVISRKWIVLGVAVLTVALVALILVDPALAQQQGGGGGGSSSNDPGKGIGQLFQSWAVWLIPGVAALVGLPALGRHDAGAIVGIVVVAMVLAAFAVMGAEDVKKIAAPVVNSFTGG